MVFTQAARRPKESAQDGKVRRQPLKESTKSKSKSRERKVKEKGKEKGNKIK